MTPTPPSANSSTGGRSPDEQFRVVRRRNRVPLSCNPCRLKKKCDRSQPCSNCTKREGVATESCSYAAPAARKKSHGQTESSPDDMQNRIDRLEGLVLSLMHNGAGADPSVPRAGASVSRSVTDSGSSAKASREEPAMVEDDSDVEDGLAASLGVLKVDTDKGKSTYIGQEHWHLILADITEVKNYFVSHKKELETSYERVKSSKSIASREGPTLLLGADPASEVKLRAELPPKSGVLTLCDRYFNSTEHNVGIIHGPTFLQQLRSHWQDPSKTPIMWLGLLYSILSLAILSYHKAGDEPPEWRGRTLELAFEFRMRTVQCLTKADYTKPVEYTVETMLLYLFGECSSRWDADLGLWLIMSLITRVAFRMGYHRDAKWFPSITPYQAEMRRRTWALVRICDVMFSHVVSLPGMINELDCDTQLPNNLFDDDFNPETQSLPPSRPTTETTPISYLIAKARLGNELGNILHATTKVGRNISYDEIIRFDAKLRQIRQELPPHLRLGPLGESSDPVTLIVARFNIDILYQRILCLLHKKYVPRARQNPRYAHSRRSAIDASLQAMGHLQTLHRESQGNGRLRAVSWYVKSIATKDMMLPAALLVSDLHLENMARQSPSRQDHDGSFLWTTEERAKMLGALEDAAYIWRGLADTSMDAFKASKVLDIMLQKITDTTQTSNGFSPAGQVASATQSTSTSTGETPATVGVMTPGFFGNPFDPMSSFPSVNNNTFMGMDQGLLPPNFGGIQPDGFSLADNASPMSMFPDLGGGSGMMAGPNAAFDWALSRIIRKWRIGELTLACTHLDQKILPPNAKPVQ